VGVPRRPTPAAPVILRRELILAAGEQIKKGQGSDVLDQAAVPSLAGHPSAAATQRVGLRTEEPVASAGRNGRPYLGVHVEPDPRNCSILKSAT